MTAASGARLQAPQFCLQPFFYVRPTPGTPVEPPCACARNCLRQACVSVRRPAFCAVMLIPCLLHFAFLRRRVRPVSILLPGIALLALAVVWANLISESGGMVATGTTPTALLAAMALLATVLMPMLLESSVSAAQRDRPALAAGAVWLATHLLVVAFAAALQLMRVSDAGCPAPPALVPGVDGMDAEGGVMVTQGAVMSARARTLDRIKWLCVVSIGLTSIAAVSSLLIATKCAPWLADKSAPFAGAFQGRARAACRIDKRAYFGAGTPDEAPMQSFHSLYMTSNTRDALHPDNLPQSFVRPVWWQNPTAEMRTGLKEALEELQAAKREDEDDVGARHPTEATLGSPASSASLSVAHKGPEAADARTGPGGVPRPVRLDLSGGGERRGIGSSASRGDGDASTWAAARVGRGRSREAQHSGAGRRGAIWGSRHSSWDSRSERPSTRGTSRGKSAHSTVTSGARTGEGCNV